MSKEENNIVDKVAAALHGVSVTKIEAKAIMSELNLHIKQDIVDKGGLTDEEDQERKDLEAEIIVQKGEKIGTCYRDADPVKKARLRELYGKKGK